MSPSPSLPLPRGLRRRLVGAFAAIVAIVALASGLSLWTHNEVHALLEDVAETEKAIEAALRLSAAVRDQYAHQAHTIILNNRSHLHHYQHAQHEVKTGLAQARAYAREPDDEQVLDEIEAVAAEMNRNFQEAILPGVPGAREALVQPHDRALALVMQIVELTDKLTQRFADRVAAARDRAAAAKAGAVPRSLGLVALAMLVAMGVGVYVDRAIARPVRSLEAGARRLAKGDLTTRIDVDRDDELGSLAQRFNEMAAALEARQRELVRAEKLAGIGRLAAGVAHEINNPLGVILGYAKLLARSADARDAADARAILVEVERCQEIVAGLLDLSRPPRLSLGPVLLAELAREVAEQLPEVGVRAKVEVRGDEGATVEADAGKLRQIVWNLLRNGGEASPDGALLVEVTRSGEEVRLTVQDDGPGVPAEARARLFEPFFTTKPKGTGLGLAVSASLARAHGGSLVLAETARGARFELSLPADTFARGGGVPEVAV